jgi:hypothetical protein
MFLILFVHVLLNKKNLTCVLTVTYPSFSWIFELLYLYNIASVIVFAPVLLRLSVLQYVNMWLKAGGMFVNVF